MQTAHIRRLCHVDEQVAGDVQRTLICQNYLVGLAVTAHNFVNANIPRGDPRNFQLFRDAHPLWQPENDLRDQAEEAPVVPPRHQAGEQGSQVENGHARFVILHPAKARPIEDEVVAGDDLYLILVVFLDDPLGKAGFPRARAADQFDVHSATQS